MSTLLPEFRNRLALIGRAGSDAAEWEELRGRQLRQRLQNESMSRAMSAGRSSRGGGRDNIQYGPVSSNIKIGHPLGGAGRQTSQYGWRNHPIKKKQSFHTGLDLAARAGTPVYATHAGVGRATYDKIYGNRVILSGGGMETRYAHLARSVIQQGQQIKAGQLLGYVGSTGLSTGPHLHFETWLNGKHVNPLSYFMR